VCRHLITRSHLIIKNSTIILTFQHREGHQKAQLLGHCPHKQPIPYKSGHPRPTLQARRLIGVKFVTRHSRNCTSESKQPCPEHLSNLTSFSKHRKTQHDRPYKCPDLNCSYSTTGFGKRNDLNRHKTNTHPQLFAPVLYACPHSWCPHFSQEFRRKDNCKRHIEHQHPDLLYQEPVVSSQQRRQLQQQQHQN
jgi:hypothetical protein